MTADPIFRIYSMTKPLVSVAAMMLVEDGVIQLTDPIAKFLPAFKDMQVSVAHTGERRQGHLYQRAGGASQSPCRTCCGIARASPMRRSPRTSR